MAALVDTNILVYRFDNRFPEKQRVATELLRRGIDDDSVRLPHQAILEFVAAVTRPIRGHIILRQPDALREAEEFLKQFTVLYPNEAILRDAFRSCAAYQLNWFDAHLWSYAEHYGLPVILSEDLQHDRLYGRVRVVKPIHRITMAVNRPATVQSKNLTRCPWPSQDALMTAYHDQEWGVPIHDDRALFEFLILEGAQAGLSWSTILKKRPAYRAAFNNFDPRKVARYNETKIAALLANSGIVRNRLKIRAAVRNAQSFLAVQKEFGSFDCYIWQFVGGKPIRNRWRDMKDLPARTVESDAMSKDLVKRGFTFVGSTICYAFMQATGLVNDHMVSCFRYKQLPQFVR